MPFHIWSKGLMDLEDERVEIKDDDDIEVDYDSVNDDQEAQFKF